MNHSKILIIGAGEIGRAMEKILKEGGGAELQINLWDKDPKKVSEQISLKDSVPDADFIFFCIPSFAYMDLISDIKDFLRKTTVIVSLAKGVDVSGRTMEEILKDELPENQSFGLLAGPMIAEEIMQNKKSAAVFATEYENNFNLFSRLLNHRSLKIFRSKDLHGVAIASVIKNVYAILFGICDGLDLGSNFKGRLMTKVFEEMKLLVLSSGGEERTAEGLAGLGDLIATATSGYSKNYEIGVEIAKTKTINLFGEGVNSLKGLKERLGSAVQKFQLLDTLDKILSDPASMDKLITDLWN